MSSHLCWWMLYSKFHRETIQICYISKGKMANWSRVNFQKCIWRILRDYIFKYCCHFFCCCCYCYYCEFVAFSLFLSHLQFCEKPWGGGGEMRYWLTYHIGRRKIDSIRLFSRLHKWTKWNNRLVMSEVVWSRGEKIFQTKLQLLSWWITIGMFFQLWKNIPVSI